MIDFLELAGKNGIILNHEKFQFAQREVYFAGFRVTDTCIKPLDKYIKAIVDFPTPKKTNGHPCVVWACEPCFTL